MATKTIEISKIENDYHWKPFSKEAEPTHETAKVPLWLFEGYIEHRTKLRDLRQEIETYFKKTVSEGEVVKFN
jgi:hypothetical protein